MNDNALATVIFGLIRPAFVGIGMPVNCQASNQPTTQGTPTADTVFISKVFDKRYGFAGRKDVYANGVMTHTETQRVETTYQAEAMVIIDPANQTQFTADDYLKALARLLNSESIWAPLAAQDIGILRIESIRRSYIKNDRGQFDNVPSFDFVLRHTDVLTQTISSTTTLVPDLRSP